MRRTLGLASISAKRSASALLQRMSSYAIAINGKAEITDVDAKSFLKTKPSGAYTTARTCCGGTRIFEWSAHVARTASTAAAMLGSIDTGSAQVVQCVGTADALRPKLDKNVAAAVAAYRSHHAKKKDCELRITVLVTWESAAVEIAAHVAPLPPVPAPPVRVEVRGSARSNALAKNSAWVSERAPLEALMRAGEENVGGSINELLLTEPGTGSILEGSQTNFFAIVGGKVYTAGEGVLAGTVRRVALEVCAREGVDVVLAPPNIAEARKGDWEGALISSTSRLLLPIDEVYAPPEGVPSTPSDLVCRFSTASSGTEVPPLQCVCATGCWKRWKATRRPSKLHDRRSFSLKCEVRLLFFSVRYAMRT